MEEGYGLAARGAGGIGRGIYDAVEGGDPAVVGPAGHEVADVDDETLRDGGDWLPLFLGVEDFEAAGGGVGAENCEAAVIGVGACAELAGLGSDILMRVVQGADGADGVVDGGVEEIFGEIQRDGEDLHDFSGEGAESAVVVGPGLLEFGWLGGPDVGGVAKIGEGFVAGVGRYLARNIERADVESFFDVGRGIFAF